MDRGRLEAFSDGVFAVAITLLALNLTVKPPGNGTLAHQLAHQWPGYAAYLISFFTIGIIWVNHHQLLSNIVVVTRTLLFLNLVLLLFVVLIPVATGTVADYLAEGGFDAKLAVAVYGIVLDGDVGRLRRHRGVVAGGGADAGTRAAGQAVGGPRQVHVRRPGLPARRRHRVPQRPGRPSACPAWSASTTSSSGRRPSARSATPTRPARTPSRLAVGPAGAARRRGKRAPRAGGEPRARRRRPPRRPRRTARRRR